MAKSASEAEIRRAAEAIKAGELVIFPTETVYGLGADALNAAACAQIFKAKGRPHFNPLIVHVGSVDEARSLSTEIPKLAERLMERFWPGALTLVLPKREIVPEIVTAGLPSVAVRMPEHPVALDLLRTSQRPIAAPSANRFSELSPTTLDAVSSEILSQVAIGLDGGPCRLGLESTILTFEKGAPTLLRLGAIPVEAIESVVGKLNILTESERPLAPGMLRKHYAPRTRLLIFEGSPPQPNPRSGLITFQRQGSVSQWGSLEVLSPQGDLNEAAANLFGALRRLDQQKLDVIYAESVPERELGRAINDRLRRASAQ